ncbi:MAG: hypothetical protein KGJ60_11310 [Verrucomicrobiota bacterium]|nr:hypothetical protein [Verrucomicrobiota bacterium]
MDEPHRGALILVRFVAVALMGLGALDLTLDWLESLAHHAPMSLLPCALWAAVIVLGVIVLAKSNAIAQWISDQLDE